MRTIVSLFLASILLISCAAGGMPAPESYAETAPPGSKQEAESKSSTEGGAAPAPPPAVSEQSPSSAQKEAAAPEPEADGAGMLLEDSAMKSDLGDYAESEELAALDDQPADSSGKEGADEDDGEAESGKAEGERAAADRVPEALYLSADDSNSTSSAVIVRQLIREGRYVHPDVVRTYEFLNYYTFQYDPPETGEVAIIPQLKKIDIDGEYSLQVALRSRNKDFNDMKPLAVTFLLDTSGSMAGRSLDLAKAFILRFVSVLRPSDVLSLVTFNRHARTELSGMKAGAGLERRLREEVFPRLKPNDVTDIDVGLEEAYREAESLYSATSRDSVSRLHRVIVVSDGAANAGELAAELIAKHAEDADRQGIYLAGVGIGAGFNDSLMNALTDKGRGAYLFIDTEEEIDRVLRPENFPSYFDLVVKDVRLKMQMPAGWSMEEFHGEQVSTVAAEVVPQYLAPNDQMIYHAVLKTLKTEAEVRMQDFSFEAEYRPIGGRPTVSGRTVSVEDMLSASRQIIKGDAVVAFAEMLKKIAWPLEENSENNVQEYQTALETVEEAQSVLNDKDLKEILGLMSSYERIIKYGEQLSGSRDRYDERIDAALGLSPNNLLSLRLDGRNTDQAIAVLRRLGTSSRLVPMEGYRFTALSSGPVGNMSPAGGGMLSQDSYKDPAPEYMGNKLRTAGLNSFTFDRHQIIIKLKAPVNAQSFSFDFNFFSAEYPDYVNQNYNDTFYAILEAASTNGGSRTNIAFDSENQSIEVDNNYFQNPFHPIPNRNTGFDRHGSTGWLRTSWPISGGEEFTLTFSIHDEGDQVFDSLVLLDNFQFHDYEAVGTTDPLN